MHSFLVMSSLEGKFPGRLWQFWLSAATILSIRWCLLCTGIFNGLCLSSHTSWRKALEALLHPELLLELMAVPLCGSGVPSQCHIQAGASAQWLQNLSTATELHFGLTHRQGGGLRLCTHPKKPMASLQIRRCWQLSKIRDKLLLALIALCLKKTFNLKPFIFGKHY